MEGQSWLRRIHMSRMNNEANEKYVRRWYDKLLKTRPLVVIHYDDDMRTHTHYMRTIITLRHAHDTSLSMQSVW